MRGGEGRAIFFTYVFSILIMLRIWGKSFCQNKTAHMLFPGTYLSLYGFANCVFLRLSMFTILHSTCVLLAGRGGEGICLGMFFLLIDHAWYELRTPVENMYGNLLTFVIFI